MWENSDPDTGFIGKKWIKDCTAPPFYNIGSTFHYLFNHEYGRRPLRYPDKLIDSCLALYKEEKYLKLAKNVQSVLNKGLRV